MQAVRSSIGIGQYPQRDLHSVIDSEHHDIRLQVLEHCDTGLCKI